MCHDREEKLPEYAAAGIPETWLVDVRRERILVFRKPVNGAYMEALILRRGDVLSPLAFPDLQLAVNDVLG